MRFRELPADYAAVLRHIEEDGGDGIDDLIEMVRVSPGRMQHIVKALHHKGLITIEGVGYGSWLALSHKGRRYVQFLRPPTSIHYGY